MRVKIYSDMLGPGSLPTYDAPSPVLWRYVDDNDVRTRMSKRCTLPLFEISSPTRESVLRSILMRAAVLFESELLDDKPRTGSEGTVVVSVRSDWAVVNPQSVTGFTVVVMCGIGFVPAAVEKESSPGLFWIPRTLEVDEDFWKRIKDEEVVEEVLTA